MNNKLNSNLRSFILTHFLLLLNIKVNILKQKKVE